MAERKEKILRQAVPDLLSWYQANARPLPWRKERSAYHTWISEIMLQQTRIEAVIGYYERFLQRFPTIRDIAVCDDDTLMKSWEGLGYYNRARHIKRAAAIVTEQYDGQLPGTKEELQSLPGIGEYTAAAIASIIYGEPAAAVDGNVLRVTARLLDDPRDVMLSSTRKVMTALLNSVIPADFPGDFNEGLMELGETVCLPVESPDCHRCPLHRHCLALAHGNVRKRPVRNPKVSKKSEKMTVLVLIDRNGRVAVRRRPEQGMLSGLYEFPHIKGHLSRAEVQDYLKTNDWSVAELNALSDHTHVFTHRKWLMKGWLIRLSSSNKKKDESLRFVPPDQLYSVYPIPTAFASYRDAIGGRPKEPDL